MLLSPALLHLAALGAVAAPAEFDQSHALWTEVLSSHVRGDLFDYAKLKEDRSKLDAYLGSLEALMPEEFASWKREQQYAFWIDAYNAYTVKRVVDAYPIESIRDLDDEEKKVWDQEFIPLGRLWPDAGDRKLTLNEIENEILRPKFKDARVHAALNCASRGCPALRDEAFVAKRLEDQLDEQVERWLADPDRHRYDRKENKLLLSKIFDWYEGDFVREADSVQAWIAARAPEKEREWIAAAKDPEIEFLDYSWKLNDAQ